MNLTPVVARTLHREAERTEDGATTPNAPKQPGVDGTRAITMPPRGHASYGIDNGSTGGGGY